MNAATALRCTCIAITLALSATFSFGPANGQSEPTTVRAPAAVAAHTEALPNGAAESKLDTGLLIAVRPPNPAAAPGKQLLANPPKDNRGRVLLDIKATVSPDLLTAVETLGGTVVFAPTDPKDHTMRAWIPLDKITALAARKDVFFARRALPAVQNGTDSEADVAHAANLGRNQYGISGAGVKVGVISNSADDQYGALNLAIASGDISNKREILKFQAGSGDGEGLAMLEIVHAIAPDAQLYFATANNGPGAMAQNIRNLAAAGCNIIVDDITFADESPFQDGEIARAVDEVSAKGVLYFSSAANSGNKQGQRSSTFEGDFKADGAAPATWTSALGLVAVTHPGVVMGFPQANGQMTDRIVLNPGVNDEPQSVVSLFWDDPLGDPNKPNQPSANQYDVYAFDAQDRLIGLSTTTMGAQSDPNQVLSLGATSLGATHPSFQPGDYIKVVKATQALPRFIHLEAARVPFNDQSVATNGSTRGHNASDAANAFSVGAVGATPAPYASFATVTPRPTSETFSSDGPRRMFYKADGTAYGSDLTSAGGHLAMKPDIAAADRVTTTVSAMLSFWGSSAAAPNAAAIAALLLSYRPNLAPADVRKILIASTVKIGDPNWDAASGYGIPMADQALLAAATLQPLPQFAAGPSGALILNADGTMTGWTAPAYVRWKLISAGTWGRMALSTTGLLGTDHYGGVKAFNNADYSSLVAISPDGWWVRKDGTAGFWAGAFIQGIIPNVPDVSQATNVISISGRIREPFYLLKRNGTVQVQHLGDPNKPVLPFNDIIAIQYLYLPLGCALLQRDGTVITIGTDNNVTDSIRYGQWAYVPRPAAVNDVVEIATGWAHVLALRKDGTVIAWGNNQKHQAEVPAGLTGVIRVAAFQYMSYALTADGRVVSWGGPDVN